MTIGDETEDVQCVLWPRVFTRYRGRCRRSVLLVRSAVAHRGAELAPISLFERALDLGIIRGSL